VDDHPRGQDRMSLLISSDAQIRSSAGSVQETLRQILSAESGLLIVDFSLKDGPSLDLIKTVKER